MKPLIKHRIRHVVIIISLVVATSLILSASLIGIYAFDFIYAKLYFRMNNCEVIDMVFNENGCESNYITVRTPRKGKSHYMKIRANMSDLRNNYVIIEHVDFNRIAYVCYYRRDSSLIFTDTTCPYIETSGCEMNLNRRSSDICNPYEFILPIQVNDIEDAINKIDQISDSIKRIPEYPVISHIYTEGHIINFTRVNRFVTDTIFKAIHANSTNPCR